MMYRRRIGRIAKRSALLTLRMYVWWPDMRVERFVSRCEICQKNYCWETVSKWPEVRAWKKLRSSFERLRKSSPTFEIVDTA